MQKILCALLVFTMFLPAWLKAQDVPGSKDHPLISRYPGAAIGYFEEKKYASYKMAVGPQTGYKQIKEWVHAEGKLTRIYYIVKGSTTLTEIYRNYLTALNKGGFTILAQGIDDKKNTSQSIGGRTFLTIYYENNPFPIDKGITLVQGSSTSGGSCYIAAHLKTDDAEAYVTVGGGQYKADEKVLMVDILEKTVMEDDLIHVDANEMLKSIRDKGKVALYGIFFDSDKAVVKPESKPALAEIANLMKANGALSLYVIGHTDMQGTLQHNMDLSERRATAVVNELVNSYGIAASRLTPHGVGSLAPVATNKTEKGRTFNRRVELVEK